METTLWENEVSAAAKWWADLLRNGGMPKVDIGARSARDMEVQLALQLSTKDAPSFSEDQAGAFEQALIKIMSGYIIDGKWAWDLTEPNLGGYRRVIGVDYHPDGTLTSAADLAGIKGIARYLPIKTTMWVSPGSVTVRHGYGAPRQTVFAAATDDAPGGQP